MSRPRFGYFDTLEERDMDLLDDDEVRRLNARARAHTIPAPALSSAPTMRTCAVCRALFNPGDPTRNTEAADVCSDHCDSMAQDRTEGPDTEPGPVDDD